MEIVCRLDFPNPLIPLNTVALARPPFWKKPTKYLESGMPAYFSDSTIKIYNKTASDSFSFYFRPEAVIKTFPR
jgi:hypothetical protein